MPNLKILINSHSENVLKYQPQSNPKTWNCLKKEVCPTYGICLTESLLYYATITCDEENYAKLYKRICEATFKKPYANHHCVKSSVMKGIIIRIDPHNGCYMGKYGIFILWLCRIVHFEFGHFCYAERIKVPHKSQYNIWELHILRYITTENPGITNLLPQIVKIFVPA